MTKLTAALVAATVAATVTAVAGWTRTKTTAARTAAPTDTVTLSRTARVDGVALRMDVALLRRAGGTATLDLRLVNGAEPGGASFDVGDHFDDDGWEDSVSGIYLIDSATGQKIRPRFDGHSCVCTRNGSDIELPPGATTMLTATFPAPSPGTASADVVVPHFGAFRDVPLADARGQAT